MVEQKLGLQMNQYVYETIGIWLWIFFLKKSFVNII